MTTPSVSPEPSGVSTTPDLGLALRRLHQEAVRYGAAKVDAWVGQLKGVAEPAGATDRAVVEGAKAWATGAGSPGWAALRGAWTGADGKTRAVIIATLLLVAVLAPVALLLLLLALLVAGVVLKARSAATLLST